MGHPCPGAPARRASPVRLAPGARRAGYLVGDGYGVGSALDVGTGVGLAVCCPPVAPEGEADGVAVCRGSDVGTGVGVTAPAPPPVLPEADAVGTAEGLAADGDSAAPEPAVPVAAVGAAEWLA
jgi:hypothetical protein